MAVLIEAVNRDTSRREELEAKKGITERKIEDLRTQLKKIEGKRYSYLWGCCGVLNSGESTAQMRLGS